MARKTEKEFTVVAHNNSESNRYIGAVTLNGKPYNNSVIHYDDIMAGGTLELEMTAKK